MSLSFLQFILIHLRLQDPDQPVSSELADLDPHYLYIFKSMDLESRDVTGVWKYHARLVRPGSISFRTS